MSTVQVGTRLYRSHGDRMIAGVCGGIARRFGLDPTVVRILFALSVFLPGPQVLLYFVLWLIIPLEPAANEGPLPFRHVW